LKKGLEAGLHFGLMILSPVGLSPSLFVAAIEAVIRTTAFKSKVTPLLLQHVLFPGLFRALENLAAVTIHPLVFPTISAATAKHRLFILHNYFAAEAITRTLVIVKIAEFDSSTISNTIVAEEKVRGHPRLEV